MMFTILLTGVGGPGIAGTIQALRDNPDNQKVYLIGVDTDKGAVGQYFVDKFFPISPASDKENYLRDLLRISKEANVISPSNTCELLLLAENKKLFEAQGVAIAVSSPESIRAANNKWLLSRIANDYGIPVPKSYLARNEDELREAVNALGYPGKKVVVKPPISNGSRGLRVLTAETQTVEEFLSTKPEAAGALCNLQQLVRVLRNGDWPKLIVSEYLPGREWSVDCYRDSDLNIALPRVRSKIRSGVSFVTETDLRNDIMDYSTELANILDLKYAFGFQFRADNEDAPRLIEANPRIQGSMLAGALAGFNLIYYAAIKAVNPDRKIPAPEKATPIQLQRFWGALHKELGASAMLVALAFSQQKTSEPTAMVE